MDNRIKHHPILGDLNHCSYFTFDFDGKTINAREGETVAAALLANEIRTLRRHEATGNPRGFYCNIGHCFECRVEVDGQHGVRACMTLAKKGMSIRSLHSLPKPFQKGKWSN
ncbi:(2Fe-2S)-binding protein [Alteribacillus bidgolensis]|uniref:Sarcosine oxidase subunit alpha n=1 Tax=Alteribacillus bidgolensis TaxID=930129 RepID=A0A1G8HIG2_9BACI|nr:(2Fe-2S)-binding protein [Alteribacillus bidgolensis]SDI06352.1 sarcosine oxidase subunit alpha [Alteribacillus bidgolensis]